MKMVILYYMSRVIIIIFQLLSSLLTIKNVTEKREILTEDLHFIIAAQHGHLQIVKHLVERKQCDTDMKDIYLDTPLHLACVNGHLNVVAYLSAPEICSNIEERGKDGLHLFVLLH